MTINALKYPNQKNHSKNITTRSKISIFFILFEREKPGLAVSIKLYHVR